MPSTVQPTCFLIADISGYTSYLAGVEIDHAQDIIADLIGTVVTALRPSFRLAKLEGDAAFTYAPAEKVDGTAQLEAELRARAGGEGPELATPRPDRVLASIARVAPP